MNPGREKCDGRPIGLLMEEGVVSRLWNSVLPPKARALENSSEAIVNVMKTAEIACWLQRFIPSTIHTLPAPKEQLEEIRLVGL